MKKTGLIFTVAFLLACNQPKTKQQLKTVDVKPELVEEEPDFDVLEEQTEELSYYQKAVQKQENKALFPSAVVLQTNDAVYDVQLLAFTAILRASKKWFLCSYTFSEGEIEELYYITFDYNGNQLDAVLVNSFAEDLQGSVSFINDTSFVATQKTDEVELADNGNLTVLSSKEEVNEYSISPDGEIIIQE